MLGMLRKSAAFVPRYQKFESISLQQRVRLSPDFGAVRDKVRVFRQFGGYAGRRGRQRRAKPRNLEPRGGGVSVELYSSTAGLLDAVREIVAAGCKRRWPPWGLTIWVELRVRIGSSKAGGQARPAFVPLAVDEGLTGFALPRSELNS